MSGGRHAARGRGGALAAVLVLATLALAGCAGTVETARTQAFTGLDALESKLVRGVTTRADVLLLLGQPDGAGELGGFAGLRAAAGASQASHAAWYYEDVRAGFTGGSGMELAQSVLLVYFAGDVVDGFMWFSNRSQGFIR